MKLKRLAMATVAVSAMPLLIAGCTGTDSGSDKIVVWSVDRPDYDWPKYLIDAFTEETGIEVEFVTETAAQQQQKNTVVWQTKAQSYDVLMTPEPAFLSNSETDAFAPLNQFLDDPELTPASYAFDEIPEVQYAQCAGGGEVYCIPVAIDGGPALFYNKAILKEAGYTSAPESWDEVLEIARATSNDQHDGICMQGSEASPNGYPVLMMLPYFLPWAEDYQGIYLDADWKPLFDTQGAEHWVDVYAELMQDYASEQVSSYDSVSCQKDFQTGRVAMVWDNTLVGPSLWDPAQSQVASDLGVQPLPCTDVNPSCFLSAPYGFFINQNVPDERKTNSWKFIQYMTSPEAQLQALEASKNPNVATRPSVLEVAIENAASYDVPADYIAAIGYGSQHVMSNAIPNTPAFGAVQAQLFVVLSELITRQVSNEEALEKLQTQFIATLAENGLPG